MPFLRKVNEFIESEWHLVLVLLFISFVMSVSVDALAVDITGEDLSGDMETVGSIFKTADTIAFGWIAPLAAGIFGIIASIGLVRSQFMIFITCMVAALIILLVPKIVGEIKRKGGESVLSSEYSAEVRVIKNV